MATDPAFVQSQERFLKLTGLQCPSSSIKGPSVVDSICLIGGLVVYDDGMVLAMVPVDAGVKRKVLVDRSVTAAGVVEERAGVQVL